MGTRRRYACRTDSELKVDLTTLKPILLLPLVALPGLSMAQKPSDWRKTNVAPLDFARKMDIALLGVKDAMGEATYTCILADGSKGQANLAYRIRDKKTYRVEMVKHAGGNADPFSSQTVISNNGKSILMSRSTGFKPINAVSGRNLVPQNVASVGVWPRHFQQTVFLSFLTGKGGFTPFVQTLMKDKGYTIRMDSRTMAGNGRTVPQVRLFASRTPAAAKKFGQHTIEIIASSQMWIPLQVHVEQKDLKGKRAFYDWTCLWKGPIKHENKWFVLPKTS